MARGRKGLPPQVHELHGNPGKREQPEAWDPTAEAAEEGDAPALLAGRDAQGRPNPPPALDADEAHQWRGLVRYLYGAEHRVLTDADLGVLFGYCRFLCRAMRIDDRIAADGLTLPTRRIERRKPDGTVEFIEEGERAHPLLPASDTAWKQVRSLGSELGITPAARRHVQPLGDNTPDHDDPLANRGKFRSIPGGQGN